MWSIYMRNKLYLKKAEKNWQKCIFIQKPPNVYVGERKQSNSSRYACLNINYIHNAIDKTYIIWYL